MTMHRKTITVTDHQNHWIKGQILGGKFGNDSEYIRDLIRRDQESKEQLAALRHALLAGENSGPSSPLDMAEIKRSARADAKSAG